MSYVSPRRHIAALIVACCVSPLAAFANPNPTPHTKPTSGAASDGGTFHVSDAPSERTSHVWIVVGQQRHELTAALLRNAKAVTDAGASGASGSMSAAAGSAAAGSLGALAGVPFVGMAAPLLGMFGHKPKTPTQRDTWALEGTSARLSVRTPTPSFDISYASVAGVDPDAYEPVLIQLQPTSDNWRVVSQTERQFSNGGMSEPKFSEHRIPVTAESLGRGHVRFSPQAPLGPGEYGVALRPLKSDNPASPGAAPSGALEPWQSLWDFAIDVSPSKATGS